MATDNVERRLRNPRNLVGNTPLLVIDPEYQRQPRKDVIRSFGAEICPVSPEEGRAER